MQNQKQIWNSIAPSWHEYKTKPSEIVINFLKKQKGNVLDLGSGSGRHLMKIRDGKMYLVDFSKEMIELARKKSKQQNTPAEFFVADMTKLPFENNFFDSAICISSLHCIKGKEKRKKAVEELLKVLKPKTQVLVGVWNKESHRFRNAKKEKFVKWQDKGERYYYLFDEKEIHELFKDAGFKIIKTENPDRMIYFVAEK